MIIKKTIEILQGLKPFVGNDTIRGNITQVYYDSQNKKLVATDAHTLRYAEAYLGDQDLFISPKIITALNKSKKEDPVFEVQGDSLVWEDTVIQLDPQNLKFPDWQSVFPKNHDKEISFTTPDKKIIAGIMAICKVTNQSLRIQRKKEGLLQIIPSKLGLNLDVYFEYLLEGDIEGVDGVTFSAEFLNRCMNYDLFTQKLVGYNGVWQVNDDTLITEILDYYDYTVAKLEKV